MKKILSLLLATTLSCSVLADALIPIVEPPVEPKHVPPTFEPTVPHYADTYDRTKLPLVARPTCSHLPDGTSICSPEFIPTYMDDPLPSIEGKPIETTHIAPDYISDFNSVELLPKNCGPNGCVTQNTVGTETKSNSVLQPLGFSSTVSSGSSGVTSADTTATTQPNVADAVRSTSSSASKTQTSSSKKQKIKDRMKRTKKK